MAKHGPMSARAPQRLQLSDVDCCKKSPTPCGSTTAIAHTSWLARGPTTDPTGDNRYRLARTCGRCLLCCQVGWEIIAIANIMSCKCCVALVVMGFFPRRPHGLAQKTWEGIQVQADFSYIYICINMYICIYIYMRTYSSIYSQQDQLTSVTAHSIAGHTNNRGGMWPSQTE